MTMCFAIHESFVYARRHSRTQPPMLTLRLRADLRGSALVMEAVRSLGFASALRHRLCLCSVAR